MYKASECQRIKDLDLLFFDDFNVDDKYNALILNKEVCARKEINQRRNAILNNMPAETEIVIPRFPYRNVRDRNSSLENYPPTYVEAEGGRPVEAAHRRHFEHNIHLARQVLWGNSGDSLFTEFIDDIPLEDACAVHSNSSLAMKNAYVKQMKRIAKLISSQEVTSAQKQSMLEDYRKDIKPDEVLNTCGICGYRDYESLLPVTFVKLTKLSLTYEIISKVNVDHQMIT